MLHLTDGNREVKVRAPNGVRVASSQDMLEAFEKQSWADSVWRE